MHAHNVYLCGWRKCQRAFFVLLLLLLVSNIKLYICSLLFWIHSPFSSQIITGAGKGTHGPKIEDMMSIPQLSTGDMLRAAVADKTEVGQKAEAIMKAGGLVSDDIVVGIIRDRIQAEDCKFGFILVRTLLCLSAILAFYEIKFDFIVAYMDSERPSTNEPPLFVNSETVGWIPPHTGTGQSIGCHVGGRGSCCHKGN